MPEGTLARTHSVGVVTQITATLRLCLGWSGQYSLFDFSCKLSPFSPGLLTICLMITKLAYAQKIVLPRQNYDNTVFSSCQ